MRSVDEEVGDAAMCSVLGGLGLCVSWVGMSCVLSWSVLKVGWSVLLYGLVR